MSKPRKVTLTFETVPLSTEYVPSREDISYSLSLRMGEWAVVARPDRYARAESMAKRINEGREYGEGCEATIVKIGAEIRVYARMVG